MLRRLLCLAACLLFVSAMAPRAPVAGTERWLFVSDIHFNPFSDPPIVARLANAPAVGWRVIFESVGAQPRAGYGSDTNFALLESSLDAMARVVREPAAIVIAGDMLAHHFHAAFVRSFPNSTPNEYDAFVDKTETFIAEEFREAFPRARAFPLIGNNDGYCGDYRSTPNSPFLANMAQAWAPMLDTSTAANGFIAQFSRAGYYAIDIPDDHIKLVVLNDVLWSPEYQNACGVASSTSGADELAWLTNVLKTPPSTPAPVAGQQNWIIAHIPPGVDAYATLAQRVPGKVQMLLAPRFNDPFIQLLEDPANRVGLAIGAHLHMNEFRIVGSPASNFAVAMPLVPSISPIFGNNPSFEVVQIERSVPRIIDSATYVLRKSWKRESDFDKTYDAHAVGVTSLRALHAAIFSDDGTRAKFANFYGGGSARATIAPNQWRAYWCAQVALTVTAYTACAIPQIDTQRLPTQPTAPPAPSPQPS